MASLTQKDRRALLIGISALVVFILVQFVFFPLLDQRKRLAKGISIKEKGLAEMRAMQTGISQLSHRSDTLEQRVAERRKDFDKKEHGTLDVTMWVISLIQAEEDGV
ncbi:MAG: hypothetical protein QTN59_04490 [Candidatus Electrothrix communis]|nr:MAG: hypothetical protein QTN59_04490 [Candidatus Electrothrix communis]